ncbi:predicted protein [Chaetomium globosum CBS 148.51]|uniref:Uncharacterized protein n=1 Tax=Chaetomium globosum (strain ATCC 6205 / CBS 148.51 / DSM 1962 / NBRC 6347 / NRRL 1970) TaxID=306901 RepID=Q2H7Z5_CHAGB|nr:uncharacterized protein CHGG_03659 [Chaetomium globosum CBS 148.51]EAQ91724.1 predicted protein [Chaetomium globosum CBS 148.51]
MKFFSTALAAFAVGSAIAAPVLEGQTVPAPCPCSGTDKTGVDAPHVDVPSTCGPGSIKTPIKNHPANGDNDVDVAAASIVAKAEIDAQALVKVIAALEVDLKVLQDCAPQLDGLVIDAGVIVAADLEVVLDLVVRVQALIAKVEVCLKALVVLDAKILAVIGADLKACLGLIVNITAPIVNLALSIVAKLTAVVELQVIVGQIGDCAHKITNTCDGITGLLGPVFALLHL